MQRITLTNVFLTFLLMGCATYEAKPLPVKADLAAGLNQQLIADSGDLKNMTSYAVALSDGLDMTETAIIAVLRNPDLKAQRRKLDVARAQVFAARLLPDPQISLSLDHPTEAGAGLVNAFAAGLSYDIRELLSRGPRIDAARATEKGADMDMLWQEWQVVQKARTLYVQKYYTAEKMKLLQDTVTLYETQSSHSRKALAAGDVTLDQAGIDLTALLDARSRLNDLERTKLQTDHDLNALLGLAPDVETPIQTLSDPQLPQDLVVKSALSTVTLRRPDLMALQAAYDSQEKTLYKAVLEQFPSVTVSFNHARDTSNVHTTGLGISVNLPIFNRNRGEIAVQNATREQLLQEYQARLDQTTSDTMTLWQQLKLLSDQENDLKNHLPELAAMAEKARKAYKVGDFPALSYITMENGLLSKKLEYLDLQQTFWTNRIGLDTLLAWPAIPQPNGGDNAHG